MRQAPRRGARPVSPISPRPAEDDLELDALTTAHAEPGEPGASLADDVYRRLLADILSVRLSGGMIVQERRLADQLGVSRSPLRDALGRLEGQGLLTRNARGLLTICVVSLPDYVDAMAMRQLVEPEAAALACREPPEAELTGLYRLWQGLADDSHPDPDTVWRFDDQLHETIARLSGNPFLARTVRDMRRYTTIFERQTKTRRVKPGMDEHRAILDALQRRDRDEARALMALHLARARENVLENY